MKEPTAHPFWPVPRIVDVRADGGLVVDVGLAGEPMLIECSEPELMQKLEEREKLIKLAKHDPLRYGAQLKHWRDAAELMKLWWLLPIFGGNRASKTEFCLTTAMRLLVEKPEANVLMLQNNHKMSVAVHQKGMWRYMPPEWRNIKRGKGDRSGRISYTDGIGFSDALFVGPNGSTCMFGNYLQDKESYEGVEFDLVVADENLPLSWLKNLPRALATRDGKLLWPFTSLEGLTLAMAEIVTGARTIKSLPVDPELNGMEDLSKRHVPDCPPGHMPYIQKNGDVHIIYFHSILNPFGNYPGLKQRYGKETAERVLRRFYGFCRKTTKAKFPKFGDGNIIPHEELMLRIRSAPGGVTRYQVADPAGARNMFMIWVAVDEDGRHYVYREWPDKATHGDWAEPSEEAGKWDGMMGPAQANPHGHSVTSYKDLMLSLEGKRQNKDGSWKEDSGEEIYERYVDPRSGAARAITDRDGGATLIDRFAEEQEDRDGVVIGPALYFKAAPGLPERTGIDGDKEGEQGINDLLRYNDEEPITPFINEPKFYISAACGNTIWALRHYTGNDGSKAACKDPIDCLRYMATSNLQHFTEEDYEPHGGGSY